MIAAPPTATTTAAGLSADGDAGVAGGTAPASSGGSPADGPPFGLAVVGTVVAVVFSAPLVYLAVRNGIELETTVEAITSRATLDPLRRTVTLAVAVSATAAAVGTGLAWLTTRSDLPWRRLWRTLAPLPLVFPSFVAASALLAGFARGGLLDELLGPIGVDRLPDLEGFSGAWLVLSLFTYPYVFLPVAARFATLPPSLEESARLLGRSPLRVFRSVVLPQAAPAVAAGTLLVFLYTVSDFGAVQLLRYDTFTRVIYGSRVTNPGRSLALSLLLGLLAVAVVAGERLVARRRTRIEAVRARRPLQVPLGRWRWPAFAVVVAVLGSALLGPVIVLGWWVARGLLGGAGSRSGNSVVTALDDAGIGDLVVPAANTAVIGVVAAVATVAAILPVAYLTGRYRSRVGDAANALVVGGFALPGLVIAFAIGYWALRSPASGWLYQSFPLLVAAYVMHFGAQSMRASQVAVAAVPRGLEDAARMLGAARWRRLRTVELPLMLPGLGAGAGLVLLSVMKELPATLYLRPIGFETLATEVWGAASEGYLARAGLGSLVLVALSGMLTWVLVVRRSERFD